MQRQTIQIDGLRCAWLRLGPSHGEPLVLLHGGGLDRAGTSWGPILPQLAERRPVIAPDMPGHGASETLAGSFRIPDLGRWLVRLLDAIEVPRAVLAGISMGGATALWAALNAPERVSGVVPVASYGLVRRMPMQPLAFAGTRLPLDGVISALLSRSDVAARGALAPLFHDTRCITDDLVAEAQAIVAETGSAAAFTRFLHDEIGPDGLHTCFVAELERLGPPALFIHGTHDMAVPVAAARAAAAVAGAPLVEVDAGHWPVWEAPAASRAAIDSFLDTRDAAAAIV